MLVRWTMAGRGTTLRDHAEGTDLHSDGRDRRRADHITARAHRRCAQLGLSLLLDSRRGAHAYDPARNTFTQSYESAQLDASLLLMPMVGFLPASDPRVRGTVDAIRRTLCRDGFVMRYDSALTNDGLPAGEGAFLACSFWLVDTLRILGDEQEATALFERLLALRNDVGLLAEQFEPRSRLQLGNFPQAFSHVTLVNSALGLARGISP